MQKYDSQQPLPTFGPYLLWPNGRPSQQVLSSCCIFLRSTDHNKFVLTVVLKVPLYTGDWHDESFHFSYFSAFLTMAALYLSRTMCRCFGYECRR